MNTKALCATLATMLGAFALNADTITWTGGAGNGDYATAGNWDLGRAPAETDDVVIAGAAVTVNGNYRIPASLTLQNGGSWSIGGEIQFGNSGVEHPAIYGGTVSGTLVAAQYAGSTLTISDAAIIDTGSGNNGFWQNTGSYLNFVDGSARAASFTYQSSIAANPFWFFSNPAANTPYIRYNGQAIDEATFNTHFAYTDNGDGTTTISMKSIDGWGLGAPSAGDVQNGEVEVTVAVTKYSGGDATVYFVQGTRDYGETFSSWPTATEGETVSATATVHDTLALGEGYNFIRAFLLYNGEYTASAAVTKRVMAACGDYGDLADVYEYVGEDNNLGDAANWLKDGEETAAAPVAGTDTRWFGKNANYSGILAITDKDHFDGATLALSGDCNVSSDVVFSNSTVSIATIVLTDPVVFSLHGTALTTTRTDQWFGVYPPGTYQNAADKTFVNFLPGKASSFTFVGSNNGVTDAASAKSVLVAPGYIVLDGAAITDEQWETHFAVDASGSAVTISYDPVVSDNRISAVNATSTADTATLTATISAIDAEASIYVACDTGAVTEANIVAKGEVVAVSGGVATKVASLPSSGALYHYAFAIVKDGAVAAFKAGTFFASAFDYVYLNGAWQGGEPATLNTTASVLILDALNNAINDLAVANTVVSNAAVTSTGTLVGNGTMQVYSSQIRNAKLGDAGAVCGTWGGATYMNLVSVSGEGVIRPACSYAFNAAEEWRDDAYKLLFDDERIHLNGAKVDQATYEAHFTLVENGPTGNETTPSSLTLTYWEPFPASNGTTDWTVMAGARIRLDANASIGELAIPASSNVKIDLGGRTLKVQALTIDGVKYTGSHTSSTLGILTGAGTLEVGSAPTVLIMR
ncbi:MAG: hypothetical protein IKH04_11700 [Kiritimatiellae bacterium]|nr:hypothetical protein [Kiritimatiellia bacterium]